MRSVTVFALSLSIAACHREAPAPSRGASDAATGRVTDAGPVAPPDPCTAARQVTERITAGFLRETPDGGVFRDIIAQNHFGSCARGASDAWAIVPERLSHTESTLRARWTLTHFDASGKPAALQPAIPEFEGCAVNASAWNFQNSPGDNVVTLGELTVFDYNGDGVTEVVLPITNDISEGPEVYNGRVWTAQEGAVALYEPTASVRVSSVRDVDRDGRPDLVVHQPYYDSSVHCGSGFDYTVTGPEFVMHSLPNGSFSSNDAVAIAFARAQCPTRPAEIIARGGDAGPLFDDAQSARNVVCARLWGVPEAEVVAAIQRGCPRADAEAPCSTCEDPDLLRQWAGIDTPFTLR